MKHEKQVSQEKKEEPELSYFGLQAYWGVRKPHMGGLRATEELVELCHIDKGDSVLDVGCGVGVTPCYLTKRYGCRAVGVDISDKMIHLSKDRAERGSLEDRVEFRVADVQELPFEGDLFDIVIGESILAFLEKQKGIQECVRAVKPGGYVGFNEATWIREPPTEMAEYISRMTGAEFETSDKWRKLLGESGLKDTEVRTYKINPMKQFIDEVKSLRLKDFLRSSYKTLSLAIRSSAFRAYLKESWPSGRVLKSLLENYSKCLGYGLYVGKK